ncbi:NIN-like protein [Tanacetum coccineum]
MKEGADLHNLVQKVKMHLKFSSFEFGDLSSTEVIGMQTEVSQRSSEMQVDSKDSLSVGETNVNINSINAQYQSDFSNDDRQNLIKVYANDVTISRSTLKRVCRKLNIASWPLPHRRKKCARLSIYVVVLLLVKVKRWSCSSNRHGFSAKWWICGKHNAFDSRSKLSIEAYGSSMISKPSAVPPKGEKILEPLNSSQTPKSDDFIQTMNPNAPQASFDMFPASPKNNVARVSAIIRMLTVKATFENDMIKFHFPLSSGLLELKNQVAQRFKLEDSRLHLKYRDEDDDLILIACDTDLSNLIMPFSATTAVVHFGALITTAGNRADVAISIKSVLEVKEHFENLVCGFFWERELRTLLQIQFQTRVWKQENGPWLVRNVPLILRKWSPMANVSNEDLKSVPGWVKLHDVPIAAFTEDGYNAIATKFGIALMLDTYTTSMCIESRVPKTEDTKASCRGLHVGLKSRVVYKPIQQRTTVKKSDTRQAKLKDTNSTMVGNNNSSSKTMSDVASPSGTKRNSHAETKIVRSNPFDVLNMVEKDVGVAPSDTVSRKVTWLM